MKRGWLVALIAGIAVIGLLVAGVLYIRHNTPEAKAVRACHDHIESRLKSPNDAEWSDEKAQTNLDAPNSWEAFGKVTSENSFGARVQNVYFCIVSESSDGSMTVVESTTSEDLE